MKLKRTVIAGLIFLMLLACVACGGGKPKGYYKDNLGFSILYFNGNKVEYETVNGVTKGTFTMDGNNVSISYDEGTSDSFVYDPDADTLDWFGLGVMIFSKEK